MRECRLIFRQSIRLCDGCFELPALDALEDCLHHAIHCSAALLAAPLIPPKALQLDVLENEEASGEAHRFAGHSPKGDLRAALCECFDLVDGAGATD